jgi:1-acyl-sn-glycerol-3-phosphate acyltransferase
VSLLRIPAKLVALLGVSAALYVCLHVGAALIVAFRRMRGRTPETARWRGRVFRRWARSLAWILGMRTVCRGTPPAPPFVLVANHLGYADVLLLGSQLDCVFVAKAEIARWPFVGALCRSVGTLFIDRGVKRDIPRVMQQIDGTLRGGRGVVVFPEGTSTKGDIVRPFRSSLLEAAARAGLSVSYASLSYRTPEGCTPAHQSVCWWGDAPFYPHLLELLKLPRFQAKLSFGAEPIRETDRKILATRLHSAVSRQFEAVI